MRHERPEGTYYAVPFFSGVETGKVERMKEIIEKIREILPAHIPIVSARAVKMIWEFVPDDGETRMHIKALGHKFFPINDKLISFTSMIDEHRELCIDEFIPDHWAIRYATADDKVVYERQIYTLEKIQLD